MTPLNVFNFWTSIAKSGQYGTMGDSGPTIPSDGETGFAKWCMFFHTDGAGLADAWYINTGTAVTAAFLAVELNTTSGNLAFIDGTAVPTGDGYEPNAHFIDTDAVVTGGKMNYANYGTAITAAFQVAQFVKNPANDVAGQLVGGGATVPSDSTAGWATNAMFIQSTGTTSTTRWYINVGGPVTSNFDQVTVTIT